jgi:hypothetical protein
MRFVVLLGFSVLLLTGPQVAAQKQAAQKKNGGDFSTNVNPTEAQKVPEGVIIVKGAWYSASDAVTPVPEGWTVANNIFSDPYFGITYTLPLNWAGAHQAPPPSDTGFYRVAFIKPTPAYKGIHGSMAIFAQDMFFTQAPASNAQQLVNYKKDHLQADYKMELQPSATKIGGHAFSFYAYWSPVAELHWYVLSTQIRCHAIEIVLTSRDTKLLESLVLELNNKMKLPDEAGPTAGQGGSGVPVCIKDYANEEHVVHRVEPVFTERRFNSVPVRIIIDKQGKIKHTHFLSAFPEQVAAIKNALAEWRFRPYLRDGKPVEVETGIMFGRAPQSLEPSGNKASATD